VHSLFGKVLIEMYRTYFLKQKPVAMKRKTQSTRAVLCMIIFLFFGLEANLYAQQRIQGVVTDSTGIPLPGVNVMVKKTTIGTSTNSSGHYSLNAPSQQDTLIFSFIGFKTKTVPIKGRVKINLVMESAILQGQQMVVIGYGQKEKKTITGAISQVNSQEISNVTSTSNTANILAGKLAGVRIKTSNSEPGDYGGSSFDIRGFGSPLIVIDGVPRTANDFKRLNPHNIASVSVLKDASAAIYGVRAANGVILVKTKRGTAGKIQISYQGQGGISTPTFFPHPFNAHEFAELSDEGFINAGLAPPYSKKQLQEYKNGTLPSTNWYNMAVNEYSPQTHNYLSVSGGSDKATYFFSIGRVSDDGFFKGNGLGDKRYNFAANINVNVTQDLTAQFFLNGVEDRLNRLNINSQGVLNQPLLMKPTLPAYANNNPNFLQDTQVNPSNILALINTSIAGYRKRINRKIRGSISLDYTLPFISGLELKGKYSYFPYYHWNKRWTPVYNLYTYDKTTDTYNAKPRQNPTTLNESDDQGYGSDLQVSLHYNRSIIGVHNVKALFLFEQDEEGQHNFNGSTEFYLNTIDHLYAGNQNNPLINSNVTVPTNRRSFVGRLQYNYKEKYFLTGSFRYDGSSKFAKGHRWGFFQNYSAGWLLSEEPFIRNNIPVISNLKLRASWGRLGDDSAANFQYLSGYNYPGSIYIFDSIVLGLNPRGLPNVDLTWFTSKTLDIGLDAGFWNGKLTFTADVYRRNRKGLLATRILQLPSSLGADLPQENLNGDRTEGFGIQVSYVNHNKGRKFNYKVTANMSVTRSSNRFVERSKSANAYDNWLNNTSYRFKDIIWGYTAIGNFTSEKDLNNGAIEDGQGNQLLLPGDIKYEDWNHDGVIDSRDLHPIYRGSTGLPLINEGLTLQMSWKGLDLNILLQAGQGLYVNQNADDYFSKALPFKRNGLLRDFLNRWHHKDLFDPNSPWVPGKYPTTRLSGLTSGGVTGVLHKPSTFWWHKDPYLRLKSIELGYTLPQKITQGLVKEARVFVNSFNTLTWSRVTYIDPEHPTGTNYPIMKTFNVGLDVTF
jgi:TonB-linked SusC/RagA family outer membrane protein